MCVFIGPELQTKGKLAHAFILLAPVDIGRRHAAPDAGRANHAFMLMMLDIIQSGVITSA